MKKTNIQKHMAAKNNFELPLGKKEASKCSRNSHLRYTSTTVQQQTIQPDSRSFHSIAHLRNISKELSASFCNIYAKIKLSEDTDFQERMEFDIYKRSTKLERMQEMENAINSLSKQNTDETYERLIEDARVRQKKRADLEEEKRKREALQHIVSKKITSKESDALYSRLMEQQKKTQEVLEEKRKVKKLQELEKENLVCQKIPVKSSKTFCVESGLLNRVNQDLQRRQEKLCRLREQQQIQKENELKEMFIPITNARRRALSHNRTKSRKSEVPVEAVPTLRVAVPALSISEVRGKIQNKIIV